MKVIIDTPKQVENSPNFWVIAAVEDNGRNFVYLRQYGVPLTDGTGKPLMDPVTGNQVIGFKDFIEETVVAIDTENNKTRVDLRYIDDEAYVRKLQKFFYDKILWKDSLEHNKREIDKILAAGGQIPNPLDFLRKTPEEKKDDGPRQSDG